MQVTKKESDTFWLMKAFAIFTVFFAHMPILTEGQDISAYTFDTIGMVGVPLFMMISGFFNANKRTDHWKSFRSLFIPLLIWGSICFVLHILKTPTDTIIMDWAKFVMGSKSIFYFVPMLFCCLLLTKYIPEWLLLLMGIASQVMTTYTDIIPYNDVWTLNLNPFNFIVYFIVGRLIGRYALTKKINWVWALVATMSICAFVILTKPQYHYPYTVVFTFSAFVLTYYVFSFVPAPPRLVKIGKMSFVIYLCHIQIAGFVQALYKPLWGTWLEWTKVFVAFFIVCVFCFALKWVLEQIKLEKLTRYLGFR